MKITVDKIKEMFEGTKLLLIAGVLTTVVGVTLIVGSNPSVIIKSKIPLMVMAIFLFTVIPGFFSMLFSPLTKVTAKLFDIKESRMLCRAISAIYLVVYWYIPLMIVDLIIILVMSLGNGNGDGGIKMSCAVGCFVVAVVQTRRFYTLLTK